MTKSTTKKPTPKAAEAKHMTFVDRLDLLDDKSRRIEKLLLHLCDEVMPEHPEITRIKKEIEQLG